MNLARLFSAALILLAAGPSAHAQAQALAPRRLSNDAPAPPSLSAPTLSSNYRLTLAAKSGDKALGAVSVLTCSKSIDASGMLDKPADENLPAAMLSLRGTLMEEEGGALLLNYSFGVSTPVVSQMMTSSAALSVKRQEADAKAGDAKVESPRGTVSSTISFRDYTSSGSVRVKAGSTYELVTMAGVVYSLTISPEPLK